MSEETTKNMKLMLKDIPYEMTTHKPVYTSEQAAKVRNVDIKQGVKAMILKTSNSFILALLPANRRVDMKKIGKLIGKVKLASPKEVLELTDCEVGSVPPFGHKTKLRTFADPKIFQNKYVDFNAGLHTVSIKMRSEDLKKVIQAEFIDVCE